MNVDRDRIEAALRHAVRTPDAYLTEIASHLIVAGGKRLRPVLAVAAAVHGPPLENEAALADAAAELAAVIARLRTTGSL